MDQGGRGLVSRQLSMRKKKSKAEPANKFQKISACLGTKEKSSCYAGSNSNSHAQMQHTRRHPCPGVLPWA